MFKQLREFFLKRKSSHSFLYFGVLHCTLEFEFLYSISLLWIGASCKSSTGKSSNTKLYKELQKRLTVFIKWILLCSSKRILDAKLMIYCYFRELIMTTNQAKQLLSTPDPSRVRFCSLFLYIHPAADLTPFHIHTLRLLKRFSLYSLLHSAQTARRTTVVTFTPFQTLLALLILIKD